MKSRSRSRSAACSSRARATSAGQRSLSFYDPAARSVENEIFIRANGMKLGDVAQSMTLHKGRGYVVVNNSGAVYVIDPATFRVTGVIEGVVSPRYIHFPNDTTAYITDLYDPRITVVDSRSNRIRGRIPMNGHKSTEQMVQWGDEVFVNCWSYDDKILVVDAARETLVDSIEVGRSLRRWSSTASANSGPSPTDAPQAFRRRSTASTPPRAASSQTYTFAAGDHPSSVTLNGTRDTLYFINRDVWRMRIDAEELPVTPFLPYTQTTYYEVAVDPLTSEVYVADAIDYVQHGVVYRFTARGAAVDTIRVGITPGSFCFKP